MSAPTSWRGNTRRPLVGSAIIMEGNMQSLDHPSRRYSRSSRWQRCHLTGAPLEAPVVACPLGRLYNSEALLVAMLAKASSVRHVRSLEEVLELRLNPLPSVSSVKRALAQSSATRSRSGGSRAAAQPLADPPIHCCPITGETSAGNRKFVALRPCGHVISRAAVALLGDADCQLCPVCFEVCARDRPFLSLVLEPEEEAKLLHAMPAKRHRRSTTATTATPEYPQQFLSATVSSDDLLLPFSDSPSHSPDLAEQLNLDGSARASSAAGQPVLLEIGEDSGVADSAADSAAEQDEPPFKRSCSSPAHAAAPQPVDCSRSTDGLAER